MCLISVLGVLNATYSDGMMTLIVAIDLVKSASQGGKTYKGLSFLYVCMVNTIYLLSFVETPRKFIIAELSIHKLGSSSVLIMH